MRLWIIGEFVDFGAVITALNSHRSDVYVSDPAIDMFQYRCCALASTLTMRGTTYVALRPDSRVCLPIQIRSKLMHAFACQRRRPILPRLRRGTHVFSLRTRTHNPGVYLSELSSYVDSESPSTPLAHMQPPPRQSAMMSASEADMVAGWRRSVASVLEYPVTARSPSPQLGSPPESTEIHATGASSDGRHCDGELASIRASCDAHSRPLQSTVIGMQNPTRPATMGRRSCDLE